MSEHTISARGLSKEFHIGARKERYPTLRARLGDAFTAPARRMARVLRGDVAGVADLSESFWALDDVSFDVAHGEVVGIIGPNGAGKSTLLKILSRITEPTRGYVDVEGRIGSLLEVGTGFHPELTGRDNVFLNGAILGMRRAEIQRKFDEIIAFAEIEKFVETPVKHYSSGMYVRLAFAVAAHLEPDVMLVDEVLAVGDVAFQQKCLGKMGTVARTGRTILFVSHNLAAITRLCGRVIWLDGGRIRMEGAPSEVVPSYLSTGSCLSGERIWENGFSNPGAHQFALDSVRVIGSNGESVSQLDARYPFNVAIHYRVLEKLPVARVGIFVRTPDGTTVFDAYDSDDQRYAGPRMPGAYTSCCTVPGKLLSPGRYFVGVNAGIPRVRTFAFIENALAIDIVDTGAVGSHMRGMRDGVIRPELEWRQEHSRF